jgi:hypothetical protein
MWPSAIAGHGQLDAAQQEKANQELLRERFQREVLFSLFCFFFASKKKKHTGFDFSQAEFSGTAPNPREFLGGIDHNKIK